MSRTPGIVLHAFLRFLFLAAVMGAGLFFCASSAHAAGRYFPSRYTLRGDIALTYEKRWTAEEGLDSSRFTHSYHLGLSGFAVDPRLMTFDVDTTFSQERNKPGDSLNSYGFDTLIGFLNKPARKGFFSHFPQPIQLKFSYYKAGDAKGHNYGISFAFDPFETSRVHRQYQQQQQRQKQVREQPQPGQPSGQPADEEDEEQEQRPVKKQITPQLVETRKFPFPLPTIFVDYDKTSYSLTSALTSFKADTDLFSLRLVDKDVRTEYLAEYNYNRYKGVADFMSQFVNVEVNYRDYWKEQNKRFDSYNRLYLTDFGGARTLSLSSRNLWDKRLGADLRDNLTFAGGGSFFTSDFATNSTNYSLDARAEYGKNFSERLLNRTFADFGFGNTGTDTIYSVRVLDEANYHLSRHFSLTGRAAVGQNELGPEFGAGAGLSVRTFISISPSYDFTSLAASEGRTNTHRFSLDLSGRVYKSITLSSRNSYGIRDVGGSSPFKEKVMDLREEVFWILPWMNINLGASRLSLQKADSGPAEGEAVDFEVTSVYSNLSAPLFKRAFLTLNTIYTKEDKDKTLSVRPIFTWYVRLITLTAEYELIKTSGERNATSHRVFFRLTRTFSRGLRGFW